jgi:hypothetical protein
MALILNSAGKPEPSPEIGRRLRAIHSGLHLRFLEQTGEHWAVCMHWQSEDRRWEYVQNGTADPANAYDIIGYLPMACSADEAPAYLERSFRTYPRDDVKNMADKIMEYNASAPENPIAAPKKRGRPRKNS